VTLLRRYIAVNLLRGWLAAFAVTAAVFGLIGLIGELDRTHLDYDTLAVMRYTVMVLPQQLLGLAPVILLLGSILGFAALARSNELTVMSCAGVSLGQLVVAVALPTLAVMAALWLSMEYVTVPLHQQAEQQRVELRYQARVRFPNGAVWSRSGQRYIRLGDMLAGNRPADIALYEFDDTGRLVRAVHAETATVAEDRRWVFEGVQEKRLVDGTLQTRRPERLVIDNLWARNELPVLTLTPESMRLSVLRNYGQYLADNQRSAQLYLSTFWQRVTLPRRRVHHLHAADRRRHGGAGHTRGGRSRQPARRQHRFQPGPGRLYRDPVLSRFPDRNGPGPAAALEPAPCGRGSRPCHTGRCRRADAPPALVEYRHQPGIFPTMRLMFSFFRTYRLHTLLMLLALLLSGIAEGVGLSALLPVLNIALGSRGDAAELPGAGGAAGNAFEQAVLDTLAALGISATLGNMLLIILAGVTLKSLFLLVAQRQVGYTAAQIGTDLRLRMLRAIMRSRWEYFLHQPSGKLTNSLATEAERSSASFVHGATATTFLIQSMIYGAVAFALSWQASLAAIVAGVLVISLSHFLVRITRRAGRRQTRLLTSLIANLTDMLQSVKAMKAMAREHLADSVLVQDTQRLNLALRRQVLSAAGLNSAQELMFAAAICLGIYLALQVFQMELATVMVLVVTLGRSFSFLGKVQKQYQKLMQGESAYWAMLDSIEQARGAEEHTGGSLEPRFEREIRFEGVCFSYDNRHEVFRDLSLCFQAGTLTTVIGPSGSGKTTIIDLTIGLLAPDRGTIFLDDTPLRDVDVRAWRGCIGYVPQDTVLLHTSILDNVTLGDHQVSREAALRALQAAGAWDFIQLLPDGLDTVVGERGGKLSGGQRQRIVIARALVKNPRLLILDEATSALDPETERAVRQTMEGLKGQLTILAITHNPAMAEAADRVYRLRDGRAELLEDRRAAENMA